MTVVELNQTLDYLFIYKKDFGKYLFWWMMCSFFKDLCSQDEFSGAIIFICIFKKLNLFDEYYITVISVVSYNGISFIG